MSAQEINPLPEQIYKMFNTETPCELFIFLLSCNATLTKTVRRNSILLSFLHSLFPSINYPLAYNTSFFSSSARLFSPARSAFQILQYLIIAAMVKTTYNRWKKPSVLLSIWKRYFPTAPSPPSLFAWEVQREQAV